MEACSVQSSYLQKSSIIVLFLLTLSLLPQCFSQTDTGEKRPEPVPRTPDSACQEDVSKWPGFLIAFEGGSGRLSSPHPGPTAYGGFKIGGSGFTLDIGYDRIPAHNGFSTELSGMLPVFRFPRPQSNATKNYLRVYAEPGLGYRSGGIGVYPSAKVMMVLFSDRRLTSTGSNWSPFIEVQRRFSSEPGQRGDLRVMIGIMSAICEHCGLD
jgi:hypothetical protein